MTTTQSPLSDFPDLIPANTPIERRDALLTAFRREADACQRILAHTENTYQAHCQSALHALATRPPDGVDDTLLLRRLLLLIRRFARRPFPADAHVAGVWPAFCGLPGALWHQALNAGTCAYQALAAAAAQPKQARLLAHGLRLLHDMAADRAVRAFCEQPDHWLRAVGVVGTCRPKQARGVIEAWLQHPLLQLASATPAEIAGAVAQHLPPRCNNPIPSKLAAQLRGEGTLSAGQEARMRRLLRTNLLRTQIDLLGILAREVTR